MDQAIRTTFNIDFRSWQRIGVIKFFLGEEKKPSKTVKLDFNSTGKGYSISEKDKEKYEKIVKDFKKKVFKT